MNPRVSAREFAGPGKLLQDRDELTTLVFDDNRLLAALFGEHDEHLALIEHRLGVDIARRGNRVAIKGPPSARGTTEDLTVDHRDPNTKGRTDLTLADVDVLCRSCNARKGRRGAGARRKRSIEEPLATSTPQSLEPRFL